MAVATRRVTIQNLMGLHIRPITALVMLLQKNRASGEIAVDDETITCSALELTMAADKFPQGTEIELRITHENPEPIADQLVALFAARFNVPGD